MVLYLRQHNFTGKIYLVGSDGFRSELEEGGFATLPIGVRIVAFAMHADVLSS